MSIYLIECAGRVKIGFSVDAPRRVAGLSSTCPFPCVTLGIISGSEAEEQQIHALLADARRNGEWFERTTAVGELVMAIAAGQVADGAAAIAFLGGEVAPRNRFFGRVFDAFPTIVEMSAALGVPYVTAKQMQRRDSIATDHWFQVQDALKARGHQISTSDLMEMALARRAAISREAA